MAFPLQVSFHQIEASAALRARIAELAARLERFSSSIMRVRVLVERPVRHEQQGALYDIRISLAVPGAEIVIRRSHAINHAHEDVYVAVRDAFRAARRQLEDYERIRRGELKRRGGIAQPAPRPGSSSRVRPRTQPGETPGSPRGRASGASARRSPTLWRDGSPRRAVRRTTHTGSPGR